MSRLEAQRGLLERMLERGAPPPLDDALAKRLERSMRRVQPDVLFRRRLRGSVLNQYVATREGLVRSPRRRREMGSIGRVVLYASVVVALTLSATGAAAAGSLPGDPLYPVKLQLEEIRLQMAPPAMRADLIGIALNERLAELEQLAAVGKWEQVPGAAQAVAAAERRLARSGTVPDPTTIEALRRHAITLEGLIDVSPASAQEGLRRALAAATAHGQSSRGGPPGGSQASEPPSHRAGSGNQGQVPPTRVPKPRY